MVVIRWLTLGSKIFLKKNNFLAECGTRQRFSFKKKISLPSAWHSGTRQRIFLKTIISLPSAGTPWHATKIFKKKKNFAECSANPSWKGPALWRPTFLCRVPSWHSPKTSLPWNSLLEGFCRMPFSAKTLPSVIGPLPNVLALGKALESSSGWSKS